MILPISKGLSAAYRRAIGISGSPQMIDSQQPITPTVDINNVLAMPADLDSANSFYVTSSIAGVIIPAVPGKRFIVNYMNLYIRNVATDTASLLAIQATMKGATTTIIALPIVPSTINATSIATKCLIVTDLNSSLSVVLTGANATSYAAIVGGYYIDA